LIDARPNMENRSATPVLSATTIEPHRGAIQRLLRSALPTLADFCFVFLATGPTIVCIAGVHTTREGTRLARALCRVYRVRRSDRTSTVAQVIRTSAPIIRTDIHTDPPRLAHDDIVAHLHRQLAPRSALAVPISVRARVLGALSLCYSHSGRSYVARDIPAAADLATRIARLLTRDRAPDATLGLRAATGHARQGTTIRRRVAARN
jgi:GAF domain-containing protein